MYNISLYARIGRGLHVPSMYGGVWLPVNDVTVVRVNEPDYTGLSVGLLFVVLSIVSCGLFAACVGR